MKKYLWAAGLLTVLAGCTKGDDPDVKISSFAAQVNGAQWKANEVTWSDINHHLQIQGRNGSTFVYFSLPNYTGARNYELVPSFRGAVYVENNKEYIAQSGSLTITSDDSRQIKGTFSFNASNNGVSRRLETGSFILSK